MHKGYSKVMGAVKNCPLTLSLLPQDLQKYANTLMPYRISMEIECSKKDSFKERYFRIPGVIDVNTDDREQRYSFMPGVIGMVALWHVCRLLSQHSLLNKASGIHYHVDMSDIGHQKLVGALYRLQAQGTNCWILKALDRWNYKGTFNHRIINASKATWVNMPSFYNTMEVRIGEMTFDYKIIIKRMLECQNIALAIRRSIKKEESSPKVSGKINIDEMAVTRDISSRDSSFFERSSRIGQMAHQLVVAGFNDDAATITLLSRHTATISEHTGLVIVWARNIVEGPNMTPEMKRDCLILVARYVTIAPRYVITDPVTMYRQICRDIIENLYSSDVVKSCLVGSFLHRLRNELRRD